jgi:hypothetical protein
MRQFIRLVETAEPRWLYHTTSARSSLVILSQHTLRHDAEYHDTEQFVSFSEIPLIGYADIIGNDTCIGFHPYTFWGRIERVEYSPEWFEANPDAAAYIAGDGWRHQWEAPEPEDEEDVWDTDTYEDAYRAAELEAFLHKENEREWIGRHPEALTFKPEDVAVLIVKGDVAAWDAELATLGYGHVQVISA